MSLKSYDLPVMITENGICTNDDGQRWRFLKGHLEAMHKAGIKKVITYTDRQETITWYKKHYRYSKIKN